MKGVSGKEFVFVIKNGKETYRSINVIYVSIGIFYVKNQNTRKI